MILEVFRLQSFDLISKADANRNCSISNTADLRFSLRSHAALLLESVNGKVTPMNGKKAGLSTLRQIVFLQKNKKQICKVPANDRCLSGRTAM